MAVDPLAEIYDLPTDKQIIILIAVMRSTRNAVADLRAEVQWVKRGLWTLITTIIVGIIVFMVTSYTAPKPASSHTDHAKIRLATKAR